MGARLWSYWLATVLVAVLACAPHTAVYGVQRSHQRHLPRLCLGQHWANPQSSVEPGWTDAGHRFRGWDGGALGPGDMAAARYAVGVLGSHLGANLESGREVACRR
jgi:hypothetical protein